MGRGISGLAPNIPTKTRWLLPWIINLVDNTIVLLYQVSFRSACTSPAKLVVFLRMHWKCKMKLRVATVFSIRLLATICQYYSRMDRRFQTIVVSMPLLFCQYAMSICQAFAITCQVLTAACQVFVRTCQYLTRINRGLRTVIDNMPSPCW